MPNDGHHNEIKVHWLIPLTVDAALQFTSKHEMARAFCQLGGTMTTLVAYQHERKPVPGFTRAEYVHTPAGSSFARMVFQWKMLLSVTQGNFDVAMFGFGAAHLMPLARLAWAGRRRPAFLMDLRTIPVDVGKGFCGQWQCLRYRLALWLCNWFCDALTVITPAMAKSVAPHTKRLRTRIATWSSGVNLQHFQRSGPDKRTELGLAGKKVVIYHGALSRNRGLQNVVRSVGLLREEMPSLVFLLVGDGPVVQELQHLTDTLGLHGRVLIQSKVPYNEIAPYIRTADCGILPFPDIEWWSVSSPIKLMEYLAVGIPVVATDIEAHRQVAKETGGITFAVNDEPPHLAEAIRHVLKHPPPPPSQALVENTISWRVQAQKLRALLEEIRPR